MKTELQGFAVIDTNGDGFERWTTGKTFKISENKKGILPAVLEQMYLSQNVHGYNVAYGYCQKRAKELGFTFRIMNGREIEEKQHPVIAYFKRIFK